MICPACKNETEGIDHNKRGLRCTFCWERLPAPDEAVAPEADAPDEAVKKTAKRGGK